MNWHLGFRRVNAAFFGFFGLICILGVAFNLTKTGGLWWLLGVAVVFALYRVVRWIIDGFIGPQSTVPSVLHIPRNKASQSDSKMPLIPVTTVPVIPIQKSHPWILT